MGISDLQKLQESLNSREVEEEKRAIEAGLGEYYKVWREIHNSLSLGERIGFSLYLKLKEIGNDLNGYTTEFSEVNKALINRGDRLPVKEDQFLATLIEKEAWQKTIKEVAIKDSSHYFKVNKKVSSFVEKLVEGKKVDTEIMELVKNVYANESFAQLYSKLCEKYREVQKGETVKGFDSGFDRKELETLFPLLANYWEGRSIDFVSTLTPIEIPADYQKLVWKIKAERGRNAGGPHKQALREFFEVSLIIPTQSKLDKLISDENGKEIKLSKPRKDNNPTWYKDEFKEIFAQKNDHENPTFIVLSRNTT